MKDDGITRSSSVYTVFPHGRNSKGYKSLALFCHEPKHSGEPPLRDLLYIIGISIRSNKGSGRLL